MNHLRDSATLTYLSFTQGIHHCEDIGVRNTGQDALLVLQYAATPEAEYVNQTTADEFFEQLRRRSIIESHLLKDALAQALSGLNLLKLLV